MGFGIDRRARPRKPRGLRGLLGKSPDPRDVGERLTRLGRRMLEGAVIDTSPKRLTLAFHPAAAPVRIVVTPDATLEVRGETSAVGPGYHADVIARLAPIVDELDYVWDGSLDDPWTEMTAWLARELAAGATRFGIPADRSFRVDAAVLTPLGPRDAGWRDAVISDPSRAADAFAWWGDGPGDAARSRALLAMWLEVPWRAPLDADERALLVRVDAELAAARRADRELALPYGAWAELLELLGIDDRHAERVRARVTAAEPPIGYRRYPMDVELSGGWTLELSGAFVGHWEHDGARWWATDGERVIEFTSLSADGETDSTRLLAVAPEAHPVIARFAEGEHRGRAELSVESAGATTEASTEASTAGDVHVVHALMARAPHVAIVTFKGRAADQPWALATWRTLRNS